MSKHIILTNCWCSEPDSVWVSQVDLNGFPRAIEGYTVQAFPYMALHVGLHKVMVRKANAVNKFNTRPCRHKRLDRVNKECIIWWFYLSRGDKVKSLEGSRRAGQFMFAIQIVSSLGLNPNSGLVKWPNISYGKLQNFSRVTVRKGARKTTA